MITRKSVRKIANDNKSAAFDVLGYIQNILVQAAANGQDGVRWVTSGTCGNCDIPVVYSKITIQAIILMLKDADYQVIKNGEGDYLIVW